MEPALELPIVKEAAYPWPAPAEFAKDREL
jgi:hypothetical protein